MLHLLDILFTILHLAIILFNLFGWIWKPLRTAHLVFALVTLSSWLILGIWFGIGYCPITDWHWDVKRQLGEQNLPGSFIKYFADKLTHTSWDPQLIDIITGISFGVALSLSLYLRLSGKRKKQDRH